MAKSLKHWACATQVLEEKDKKFTYSLTGDLIFGKDGKEVQAKSKIEYKEVVTK